MRWARHDRLSNVRIYECPHLGDIYEMNPGLTPNYSTSSSGSSDGDGSTTQSTTSGENSDDELVSISASQLLRLAHTPIITPAIVPAFAIPAQTSFTVPPQTA